MTNITAADLKILRALQSDGALSNVELAERVGMSASPCLRRVKSLEAAGLIDRYVALLDRRRVGLGVMAYVEVKSAGASDQTIVENFKAAVHREPKVIGCYILTGAFDYMLKVVAEDLDDFADFAVKKLLRLPGVTDIRSSFVMEALKDSTELPLDHLAPKPPAASPVVRRRRARKP